MSRTSLKPTEDSLANERASEPTRTERAGEAARERACRGVRGAKPLGVSSVPVVALLLMSAATLSTHDVPFQSLAWTDVSASYSQVRDYTTLYEKEELAISRGERQRIELSFRKPLDVRLQWLDDNGKVDQVAVYRAGQNGGKLVARRAGVFGSLVGTVRLDPHDKRALEDSRHPITEIGIGHVIETAANAVATDHATAQPAVADTLDGHPVYRFIFALTSSGALFGVPGARRAIVWVDQEVRLPVKVEIFDDAGTVLERHRFRNLRLNVGLGDEVFTL